MASPFWRRLAAIIGIVDDDHQSDSVRFLPAPTPDAPQSQSVYSTRPASPRLAAPGRRRVMVCFGHDKEANRALFNWLRAIGLEPLEWNELIRMSGNASPYVGDLVAQAFLSAQAVLVFFTPDEQVAAKGVSRSGDTGWRFQVRPNVLVEAGAALVTHPDRTILVVLGDQELPSDLDGRAFVRLDGTSVPLVELLNRLEDAGCDVSRQGTQWVDPGNFPPR